MLWPDPSRVILAAALVFFPAGAAAHDFWIEPSAFRVALGAPLALQLRVGHALAGEPVARYPQGIRRFLIVGPGGASAAVGGRAGMAPAGLARLSAPGFHIIGYRSHPSMSVLEADKFESYLREEGLEHALETRRKLGSGAAPGREWYSRCAKSIVVAGDDAATLRAGFNRMLGMRLELVPRNNPARLAPGAALELELLFEGKPRAGILVRATNAGAPQRPFSARTDSRGRVRFALAAAGTWLFTAVHLFPAAEETWIEGPPRQRPSEPADWESLWASLTLEVPAKHKKNGAARAAPS